MVLYSFIICLNSGAQRRLLLFLRGADMESADAALFIPAEGGYGIRPYV
jgi:hypothetical protein